MADELDEIRRRADIVELVGQRVSLKKAGRDWKGLCPFHDDKHPSFTVSTEYGRYRCWSCGATGDVFNWVMNTQNVDFADAVKILAAETGVELQRGSGSSTKASDRERMESAMLFALNFFKKELSNSPIARRYVEDRGLPQQVLDQWEIGYGPSVGEALAVQLSREGHLLQECQSLFLVDQDGSGGFYDRFRGRLIFPIRDERGRLVAFGGRIVGDGQPKYINSSDTPLYKKSRVLYGLNVAKEAMSKSGRAVLCEGYLDVIACHRAGVTEAIASLGTALAEDHVKLLNRWCNEVVILYDSDTAGIKASEKAIDLLQTGGLIVKVAQVPSGKDPDDLLENGGVGAVQRVIEDAVAPVEFRLSVLRSRLKPSDNEYWTEVVQILATARNPLELQSFLPGVAREYPGTKDQLAARKALEAMVRKVQSGSDKKVDPVIASPSNLTGKRRRPNLTGPEIVVFRCLATKEFITEAWQYVQDPDLFETPTATKMAEKLIESLDSVPKENALTWLGRIENETARNVLSDLWMEQGEPLTGETLRLAVERLKKSRDRRSVRNSAENVSDRDRLAELHKRMQDLKSDKNP